MSVAAFFLFAVLAAAPSRPDAIADTAVARGVAFLLAHQNADGSFGTYSSGRDYEILASVPGSLHAFKVASTALAGMALRASPVRTDECGSAADRAVRYTLGHHTVGRPNGIEMYNIWAIAFSLQFLSGELLRPDRDPALEPELRRAACDLVRRLGIYQTVDGGWTYYDFNVGSLRPSDSSMTFTTGTVLYALDLARRAGVEVSQKTIDRGVKTLRMTRKEDGGYAYGIYLQYRPELGINKIKGSLGRSQNCNLALHLNGHLASREVLARDLESMIGKQEFLDIARKRPIPHEAWYQNSGYFYFFGTYYGGLVLDRLEPEDRERLWPGLRDMVASKQEPDGSFWDYPLYGFHKAYGTAFAILTLVRPAPEAGWGK